MVALRLPAQHRWEVEDSIEELAQLAESAGARVSQMVIQEREGLDSRLLIGKGKAQELKKVCQDGIDLVVFDDDLTGAQQRNLEELLGVKVLDRPGLILDIFAQRARTKEGKLQVELAQLNYLLPRLVGAWSRLSRLGGGIGTRGPGETKLEVDRRRIRRRIAKVQGDLEKVRRHRALLRRPRRRSFLPTIALVGYTNAGKSTLLNAMTRADVPVEDRLFATLDPTIRLLRLPGGKKVLLSDTVGFIRKLPHQLIAAFKATLEEVVEADLLLHVIDTSSPRMEAQVHEVDRVLEELGIPDKPLLRAYNKIDLLGGLEATARMSLGRQGVAVSALTGEGIEGLRQKVQEALDATPLFSGQTPRGRHGRVLPSLPEREVDLEVMG